MSTNFNRLSVVNGYSATNYLPAILKEYKSGWVIEYYVENPSTQELARKKIRLQRLMQRYKSKMELRKHVNNIILALNLRLSTGWNPYFIGEDSRLYTPIKEVIEQYVQELKRTVRPATLTSYESFTKIFSEYLEKNTPNIYSSMITKTLTVRFMDYAYNDRKGRRGGTISARTYNNYVKMGSAFFTWMIEKGYCKENHFSKIKTKPTEEKKRTLIGEDVRDKLIEYLKSANPIYLTMLKLIFASLLRPSEIRRLRIEDISIADKEIIVWGGTAKNRKRRIIPMTPDILEEFKKLNLQNYAPSCHIFGNEDLRPSKTQLRESYMRKRWAELRDILNLPMEMQQYSLRDTGITELLEGGLNPLTVQKFANHSSLAITTLYTKHADPLLKEKIFNNTAQFASQKPEKEIALVAG